MKYYLSFNNFNSKLNESSITDENIQVANTNIAHAKSLNKSKVKTKARKIANALNRLADTDINDLSDEQKTKYIIAYKELMKLIDETGKDKVFTKSSRKENYLKVKKYIKELNPEEEKPKTKKLKINDKTKDAIKSDVEKSDKHKSVGSKITKDSENVVAPKKLKATKNTLETIQKVLPDFNNIIKSDKFPLLSRKNYNKKLSNYVKLVQAILKYSDINEAANLYDSKVDGIFGPGTENAVKKFQKAYGLTPDGIVGRHTWEKLLSVIGKNKAVKILKTADFIKNVIDKKIDNEETTKETETREQPDDDKNKPHDENQEENINEVIKGLEDAGLNSQMTDEDSVYTVFKLAFKNGKLNTNNILQFIKTYNEKAAYFGSFFKDLNAAFQITDPSDIGPELYLNGENKHSDKWIMSFILTNMYKLLKATNNENVLYNEYPKFKNINMSNNKTTDDLTDLIEDLLNENLNNLYNTNEKNIYLILKNAFKTKILNADNICEFMTKYHTLAKGNHTFLRDLTEAFDFDADEVKRILTDKTYKVDTNNDESMYAYILLNLYNLFKNAKDKNCLTFFEKAYHGKKFVNVYNSIKNAA